MLPPSAIGVSWPWCVVATYDDEFSGSVSFALSSINQDHVVLRQKQLKVLQSVYGGHDVFAWFPTGYGKSLCYQLLPYMFNVKLGLTKAAPSERSVVYSNFSSSERRILPPLYSAVYYGRVYKIFYVKYPEIIAHAHKYPCSVYQASSLFSEAWGRG